MIELAETIVSLVVEGELTRGRQGQPVSFAPDIVQTITGEVTAALVHSRYATTGMHAAAGGGLCVYERTGCERYDSFGAEAHYRVDPAVVAIAGVHVLALHGGDVGIKIAARTERDIDRITLRATPTLIIAEEWWLPFAASARVSWLAAGIETGLTAPFFEPSAWQLPFGFTLEVTAHRQVAFGAAFVWPRLTGGREQPPNRAPIYGFDHRVATLWLTTTW